MPDNVVAYWAVHKWANLYVHLEQAKEAAQARIDELAAEHEVEPVTIEWGDQKGKYIQPTERCQVVLRGRFGHQAQIAIMPAIELPIFTDWL